MSTYAPPVEEMLFVIEHVLDAPASWRTLPGLADVDLDVAREVVQQAARFCSEILQPLNGSGDLQGCRWENGRVTTPDGYPEAWAKFVEGGWPALACAAEHDGQGLPHLLNVALFEMLVASNHGWTMYPGLQHGAYDALQATAVGEVRDIYLLKVVSGEWLTAMHLTEPQAGSDLALLRSRAEALSPREDGTVRNGDAVRVTGSKIFISSGDHDMTDNIVHLVLARLPGAAPGTKGLSLFLVPKVLPDGRINTLYCDGIEKKMGIKGSGTCQMRLEAAEGWLLGEPGGGLAAMFRMMNSARLLVGMQGLAHLEASSQIATGYARERLQSRAPITPATAVAGTDPAASSAPRSAADPIHRHPALRRILLDVQAQCLGARVLAYRTGLLLDEAHHHPDAATRAQRHDRVALLTPVVKGFLTHIGHHGADRALGVLGGYGYIHEYGIEQHVRDSRIAMIYEGTNEIQAIDLLQRKVLDRPDRLDSLLAEWSDEIALLEQAAEAAGPDGVHSARLRTWATTLQQQIDLVTGATQSLRDSRDSDRERAFRVADDYLQGLGHSLLAWAWARLARVCAAQPVSPAMAHRLALTEHGRTWLLPAAQIHWDRVRDAQLTLAWLPESA